LVDALSLKDEFLTLLGLEEILRRLDRNGQGLVRLREDMSKDPCLLRGSLRSCKILRNINIHMQTFPISLSTRRKIQSLEER